MNKKRIIAIMYFIKYQQVQIYENWKPIGNIYCFPLLFIVFYCILLNITNMLKEYNTAIKAQIESLRIIWYSVAPATKRTPHQKWWGVFVLYLTDIDRDDPCTVSHSILPIIFPVLPKKTDNLPEKIFFQPICILHL